jgi:hypothetical protein
MLGVTVVASSRDTLLADPDAFEACLSLGADRPWRRWRCGGLPPPIGRRLLLATPEPTIDILLDVCRIWGRQTTKGVGPKIETKEKTDAIHDC